jgi:hypothetical protein
MSVILRVDGVECKLTFLIALSASAFLNDCGKRPPANSIAEDFSMSRRLNLDRLRLNISHLPSDNLSPSSAIVAADSVAMKPRCHQDRRKLKTAQCSFFERIFVHQELTRINHRFQ